MAVRAVYGFDHLEGVATWHNYLDNGASFSGVANQPVKDGYAGSSTAGTGQYSLSFDIAGLIDPAATKYTVGMRIRADAVGALSSAQNGIGPGFGSRAEVISLTGAYAPLTILGTVLYLEYEVDLVSGNVRRWVNNVETTAVAVTAANLKLFRIFTGWSNYTTQRLTARDIYILDDVATADDPIVSRLGPQVSVPINGASAVGTDWTFNGTSLLSSLNPAAGELPDTNKATSPLSKAPLTVGLTANIPQGSKINAVQLAFGAKSLASGPTLIASKLSQGGSELPGKTTSVPTTQSSDQRVGIFPKAPDGAAWTPAKLTSTNLVITPDVSG